MLLVTQIPVADFRRFLDHDTGKLRRPSWPFPVPDSEFVRSYGPIRIRPSGGVPGWGGEGEVCDAHRAIRFDRLPRFGAPTLNAPLALRIAFRRFFADGFALAKFEVGVAARKHCWFSIPQESVPRLFLHCLRIRCRVYTGMEEPVVCELGDISTRLAESYLRSTTSSHDSRVTPESWWVSSGSPFILLEHTPDELITLPAVARTILDSNSASVNLAHYWIKHKGRSIRAWIIGRTRQTDRLMARNLRVNLLRLNAEHECLRMVIRNIVRGNIDLKSGSSTSESLQSYLNEATKRISHYAVAVNRSAKIDVTQIASSSEDTIRPGEREALLSALQRFNIRGNVLRKTERYAEQWGRGNVTNVMVIEEEIMGDKYEVGQAGAVGPGAHADHMTFSQIWNQTKESVDLPTLADQLAQLQKTLKVRASEPEEHVELGNVGLAEKEARKGNGAKALEYLSKVGKWALDTAIEIGTEVAAKVIKSAAGGVGSA